MPGKLVFGAALSAVGFLPRPLHGISKIEGPDSYALVAAGICLLLFLAFHLVIDLWAWRAGTGLLEPVGANPLLAYLLPDILGNLMAITGSWRIFWPFWETGGAIGMANAAAMTLVVLGLTWLLSRAGILLRL